MNPEEIEELENPTEVERKVFRFLRETPRPDSEFIGWYEPAIGEQGREPDFVLFRNLLGLLVLEVKDWLIDQIDKAYLYCYYPGQVPAGHSLCRGNGVYGPF